LIIIKNYYIILKYIRMSSKFNEALAETSTADYNYLAKLEQISNQARSIRGKDLTLKRPVTEEMVKEYQKQFVQ
jgi:hypothetical protein